MCITNADTCKAKADAPALTKLVREGHRFRTYHGMAMMTSPLQVYISALIFNPDCSLIKCLFKKEGPKWIVIRPDIGDSWSACLQTLEGHSFLVESIAFSYDSTRLASASSDKTIKIWDTGSGECLQTFKHSDSVRSVALSHDSTRLASASNDKIVRIWDTVSGECLQTFKGHSVAIMSVAFSHDSIRLASALADHTVKIWNIISGKCLQR